MSKTDSSEQKPRQKLVCRLYDGPLLPLMEKCYSNGRSKLALVGDEDYVVANGYQEWQDRFDHFEVRPDDLFVLSFAKAGTTWTQELVWCVLHGLNHEKGKDSLWNRFPFFEWDHFVQENPSIDTLGACWSNIHSMKERRLIKSHFPVELLPEQMWSKKNKMVYVCRDPRDACVSYYYHCKKLDGYLGTLPEFIDMFLADTVYYAPYWPHVLGFWKMRNKEHVLFIRYEEMKADLSSVIRKVADFLGKDLSNEEVGRMEQHLTFDTMKNNPAVNNEKLELLGTEKSSDIKFMRKGKVGDWREHFDDATVRRFKEWTEKALKDSDFPYYRDYD